MQGNDSSEPATDGNEQYGRAWLYGSFIISFILIANNNSPEVMGSGFLWKAIAVILGGYCGMYGARIGGAFRSFTAPDAVFTTGGAWSLFSTKLFWLIGPQIIGMFIGVAVGQAIIISL